MKKTLTLAALSLAIASCSLKPQSPRAAGISDKNLVLASQATGTRLIGDSLYKFAVSPALDHGLDIGIPPELIQSQLVFGGTIIAVSDHQSVSIGSLKLTSTPVIHGTLNVDHDDTSDLLVFRGCKEQCSERSARQDFLRLRASRGDSGFYQVNFAQAAENLKLSALSDDLESDAEAHWERSVVTRVDYSDKTLVIDTDETLRGDRTGQTFTLTIRWYLKLPGETDPWFQSRPNTDGVGYFTTDTNSDRTWITRWSLAHATETAGAVRYYIKGVPAEWRAVFAEAIDRWNETFVQETGRKIIEYTFLSDDDARSQLIQTGDIRYNVIEWDRVDQAGYGGLGPSLALQSSGQLITANVLVQGPKIIKKYRAWFGLRDAIISARNSGQPELADRLLLAARRELGTEKTSPQLMITSTRLQWKSPAHDPRLRDPIGEPREDFELIPDGVSFDSYMHGYFLELVGHELGHNLGLRHNFHGNIYAEGDAPSSSIMEYLGRPWRYKNRVSPYDIAAIKYGYNGDLPEFTNQFCTDENVLTPEEANTSPECMRDDATQDPYGQFLRQLDRAIDYLVNRGRPTAPEWNISDVEAPLAGALTGLSGYAARAGSHSASWHSWSRDPSRPTDPDQISDYVLKDLSGRICSDRVLLAERGKATEEAKEMTRRNVADLLNRGQRMLEAFKLPAVLNCGN